MNNKNDNFEIKIKGEIKNDVSVQNQKPENSAQKKSGGNTPSDLGAIGGQNSEESLANVGNDNKINPNSNIDSASNSANRSKVNAPINPGVNPSRPNGQSGTGGSGRQSNSGRNKLNKKDSLNNKNNQKLNKRGNQNNLKNDSNLNKNHMKNFGRDKQAKVPKTNPSNNFLQNGKGLFNGKLKAPNLPSLSNFGSSLFGKKKKGGDSALEKVMKKKTNFSVVTIFKMLPIQVKVVIITGGGTSLFLLIVIIIAIISRTSASDGNRELKDSFIDGNLTNAELCEYLVQNDYISEEEICNDSSAFKFFTGFKAVVKTTEARYTRYRIRLNTDLLYETMAYYSGDEEFYDNVSLSDINDLSVAMMEDIEESCVVKEYDKASNTCSKVKYVYPLKEISLNKYLSFLKYGTSSEHPNYLEKKPVKRKCGTGKNTDYVFGFGFVNTSSSPMTEHSACPSGAKGDISPITEEDYEKLPETETSLEELGTYGGVPNYSTRYNEQIEVTENGEASTDTTKNVVIAPSHQTGNMYITGNLSEKASMYNLAGYLKKELESRGYNVFVTAENDGTNKYSVSQTKSGIAWLNGSTGVYIALHSNASGSSGAQTSAWGPLALYYSGSADSKKFTSIVCKHMANLYSSNGRKNNQTCNVDTANRSEVPNFYSNGGKGGASLVEVGFHDNVDEASWITNNYPKIAKSLADAIDEYVG